MNVQTAYGICKNVDIEHLDEYGNWDEVTKCFIFSDYIINNGDDSYLLFGFEVHHDEDDKFVFFVEEGFENGVSDTYPAEISNADAFEIKRIYEEYMRTRK